MLTCWKTIYLTTVAVSLVALATNKKDTETIFPIQFEPRDLTTLLSDQSAAVVSLQLPWNI